MAITRTESRQLFAVAPAAKPRLTFSEELDGLATRFTGQRTRLGDILEATKGRGFDLLLVFITLPFLAPVPLPGFSIPFGLVVFLIGMRLAIGRKPWLPQKLLARELPPRFLGKLLRAAVRVVKLLEFLLRPRLVFLHEGLLFRRLAGALIMLSGLLLLLPLPLPFCNSLPALTVLLLAAGALERDGVFFLAGCFIFLLTGAYFGFLAFGGAHLVDEFSHSLMGGQNL
jgi:hypothetical protein